MNFKAWVLLFSAMTTACLPGTALSAGQTPLDLNLPSLGTVAGAELSPADEYILGAQIMRQVRADPTYMTDPETSEYLNRLGYQLVSNANTYTYQFFFFPIRDSTLNAFALPGGYIAVHTGTIISAQNESELAGVMGHEIGHVSQRHIARMIEGQKGNLALTIGSILLAILAARAGGSSGGHAAAAVAMGSQAAMIQSQLNYSRDAEREADRVGLQTLYNAGFDPKGMENFFERLHSSSHFYESAAPAYLSTHPLTVERMSDMENRTRLIPPRIHRDSLDFKLIQARLKVLQETRHDGWYKVRKEFQRLLKTTTGVDAAVIHYGLSVAAQKLHEPDEALAEARLSMKAGTSAILVRNLTRAQYEAARTASEKKKAVEEARQAVDRFPLSTMIVENYVDLLYNQNEHQKLINFLRGNTAMSQLNSNYHALLARSYEKLGQRSLQYLHTGEMYALLGATEAAVYQMTLGQKAADGDFYTMSQIDARLRELREQLLVEKERAQR